jgi:glutaredoxin
MIIEYYTRKGCPLCEKGKAVLLELQEKWKFEIIEKDIDSKDDWTEQYGLMIPVVVLNGVELQYGQIDKMFINEALTLKNPRYMS